MYDETYPKAAKVYSDLVVKKGIADQEVLAFEKSLEKFNTYYDKNTKMYESAGCKTAQISPKDLKLFCTTTAATGISFCKGVTNNTKL